MTAPTHCLERASRLPGSCAGRASQAVCRAAKERPRHWQPTEAKRASMSEKSKSRGKLSREHAPLRRQQGLPAVPDRVLFHICVQRNYLSTGKEPPKKIRTKLLRAHAEEDLLSAGRGRKLHRAFGKNVPLQ